MCPPGFGSNSVVPLMMTMLTTFSSGAERLKPVFLEHIRVQGDQLAGRGSIGRGKHTLCAGTLGGWCKDRIYRTDHSDPVDVATAVFFINSTLSRILRFRRRMNSVGDVLEDMKDHGFTDDRWTALLNRWSAVTRHGPVGPISSCQPWTNSIPPDLYGFYKWVVDALSLLNVFVHKVVDGRRASRILAWFNWIREEFLSHPYKWLRPDFVSPVPYLVCKHVDPLPLSPLPTPPDGSGILVHRPY